jgi:hypothetical protein
MRPWFTLPLAVGLALAAAPLASGQGGPPPVVAPPRVVPVPPRLPPPVLVSTRTVQAITPVRVLTPLAVPALGRVVMPAATPRSVVPVPVGTHTAQASAPARTNTPQALVTPLRVSTPRAASASASQPITDYHGLAKFAVAKGFYVTSTRGGTHNPGSAHYQGRAIDVRTKDKTPAQVAQFIDKAKAAGIVVRDERTRPLNQKVWSGPHLHLEVPRAGGHRAVSPPRTQFGVGTPAVRNTSTFTTVARTTPMPRTLPLPTTSVKTTVTPPRTAPTPTPLTRVSTTSHTPPAQTHRPPTSSPTSPPQTYRPPTSSPPQTYRPSPPPPWSPPRR